MTSTREISKAFNRKASQYEKTAKVQKEIGSRLFERLDYLKLEPRYILDLGCGTGLFTQLLKKKYPKAQVVGLDIARAMLDISKQKHSWRSKWQVVNGDMHTLPFPSGLFDLVFSSQTIHWSSNAPLLFNELNRIMNQGGCLMFSTLGPDSLKELKTAWSKVDGYAHANDFMDMHDLGDIMLKASFVDPVVDMEYLSVHYPSVEALLKALKDQGVRNIHSNRNQGVTTPHQLKVLKQAYTTLQTEEGQIPLTYEVVYGHAWKGSTHKAQNGSETVIPISQIKKVNN